MRKKEAQRGECFVQGHKNHQTNLAQALGTRILGPLGLWTLGPRSFSDVDSRRCRTGPVHANTPRQWHDFWLIWAGGQWKKSPVVHVNALGCIQSIHRAFNFEGVREMQVCCSREAAPEGNPHRCEVLTIFKRLNFQLLNYNKLC